jgi:sensor histidine kinase YesM
MALGHLIGLAWISRSQRNDSVQSPLAKRLSKFQLRRARDSRSESTGLDAVSASFYFARLQLNGYLHPIWFRFTGAFLLCIAGLAAAASGLAAEASMLAAISALFGLAAFTYTSRLSGRLQSMAQRIANSNRRDLLRSENLQIARLQLAASDLNQRSELKQAQRTALRHQMNPHFIFNTLNGICADVLAGRTLRGRSYLAAFRELVTGVMRQAEAGWISIDEEVITLKRYVEIESLRLDQWVEFNCPPPGSYKAYIPSLLLQPLVENAIWHGLRFLPQGVAAELSLTIHSLNTERIEIRIRDNGMPEPTPEMAETPDGVMYAAPPIKKSEAKNARRHASDIIRKRLQLLDTTGQCGLEIVNTADGTISRVILPTRNV